MIFAFEIGIDNNEQPDRNKCASGKQPRDEINDAGDSIFYEAMGMGPTFHVTHPHRTSSPSLDHPEYHGSVLLYVCKSSY